MVELTTSLRAPKKAVQPGTLMHPDAGGPTPNKGFEQAHSNKRLAQIKNGRKLLVRKGIWNSQYTYLVHVNTCLLPGTRKPARAFLIFGKAEDIRLYKQKGKSEPTSEWI